MKEAISRQGAKVAKKCFHSSLRSLRLCVSLLLAFSLLWVLPAMAENAEALFSQGVQAYAAEDYEGAMKLLEQATGSEPKVARYHYWLGKAYGRRAEHINPLRAWSLARKVRAEFERAVELDGNDVLVLNDLLDFYLRAPGMVGGGEDKAQAIAARLAQLNRAEGHRAEAQILAKRKDHAGAEKEFRRALELEPAKLGRLLDLASFLSERGRYTEADALFDRAAQLAPRSPEYLFARGQQLALARRNPEQARGLLEQYLHSARQPDDPPPSEVQALLKKL